MYKRMDKLVAHISEHYLFLLIPGQPPKYAPIADNQQQHDILVKCEDITMEEFEKSLKTKDYKEAEFELMYWANKNK